MLSIYILKLQGGRYYIGKSDDPMKRYQEHLEGSGSSWTAMYKPVGVERIIEKASPFDEDRYTKEYMAKYGINRVRGGSYVAANLPDNHMRTLQHELRMATDKCARCGRSGHFATNCYAVKDVNGASLDDSSDEEEIEVWVCDYCNSEFDTERACLAHERTHQSRSQTRSQTCYRCGHSGHYATDCYASRHAKGYKIDDDSSDNSDEDEDESDEY